MNRILVVCLVAFTLAASVGRTVTAQPMKEGSRESSFNGIWKAIINDLPGVDLTISQVGERLSGNAIFYFQERAYLSSPWKVTAEQALPLLKPQIAGKTVTFEVEHHICHGCAELGSNARFRRELVSGNEARLARLDEDGTADGPQLKLVRYPGQAVPPMQRGITVEMPATSNAAPMPDADQESALIVTVTREGNVYLGVKPIDPEALSSELGDNSSAKTVYIKADARASYAIVIKILDAATRAGFEKTVLLTNQDSSPQPGTVSPPKGFTMVTGGCLATHRPKLSL